MTGSDVDPETETKHSRDHNQAMFCWGSTANGELGLGGIEEQHLITPREVNFLNANNVLTSKINF